MNVVIAIDSFKGSLSSLEAGEAVKSAILKVVPSANVYVSPLADGGEGTVEALTIGMGGKLEDIEVTGPLGKRVTCSYGIIQKTKTAIIEISGAAGLTLLPKNKRNPLHTTTYGVGEVIKDAIFKGCRHFIVGIGGSATNDGGIGMLQALGYEILDKNKNQVAFGAKGLKEIAIIKDDMVLPELRECNFRIACDVKNPLCGNLGCSVVFGPQKGADSKMIALMDKWLEHYADVTSKKYFFKKINAKQEGTGAAGGLGFAFLAYMNATLESGIKIVLEETKLENYIKNADVVITGEGQLDGQTIFGKAPIGVAQIAKKYNKPVISFSGSVKKDAILCNKYGIDAFFSILSEIQTLEEAMKPARARENIIITVEQVFRLLTISNIIF